MCIGLTILIVPPSTVLGGYFMWYGGQQFVVHQMLQKSSQELSHFSTVLPRQSALGYASGIATLFGTFRLQAPLIDRFEGGKEAKERARLAFRTEITPPHKSLNPFRPPQTATELYERAGRPILARLSAGSVAFFCAGAVQAYVSSIY
jgi:hypothetical protein